MGGCALSKSDSLERCKLEADALRAQMSKTESEMHLKIKTINEEKESKVRTIQAQLEDEINKHAAEV